MVSVVLALISIICNIIMLYNLFKLKNDLSIKQKEILHDIKFVNNNSNLNHQLILDKLILLEKDVHKLPKEITIKNVLSLP